MKTLGRYSVLGWVWRVGLGLALFPLVVLAILSVLLYIPGVQRWAVDRASEALSEGMQMEVSVDEVRLKCPLDLSLNGMLAVQEGDTVLDAEELALSVRFWPLLKGDVEVDDVHLNSARLNTRDLIEACRVKGYVGRLALVSHSTSLVDELAVVSYAELKDADINLTLADSTAEDTTTSEPVNWRIDLQDVVVDNVRVGLELPIPPAEVPDSAAGAKRYTSMYAYIKKGGLHGLIDLGKEVYGVDEISISGAAAGYDGMVEAKDVDIRIDSLRYEGTGDLSLIINQVAGRVFPTMEGINEGYNICVTETKGRFLMDSVSMHIPLITMKTDESRVKLRMDMDLNAFDSISPGQMMVDAKAEIGYGEIQKALFGVMPERDARETNSMLNGYMKGQPMVAVLNAKGNMQHLEVKTMDAVIEGLAKLQSEAVLENDRLSADASLGVMGGNIAAEAEYDMKDDAYDVKMGIRSLPVSKLAGLEDSCLITGTITASGRGFDILDRRTFMNACVALDRANFGRMDLSTMTADASLKGGLLKSSLNCDNDQLQANIGLDANLGSVIENRMKGRSVKESVEGGLKLDVDRADLLAMGLIDTAMVVSTHGTADFSLADWSSKHPLCLFDVDVKGVELHTFSDTIVTNSFMLDAVTMVDSTNVVLRTGDVSVDFATPANLMAFGDQMSKLMDRMDEQFKEKKVDLNLLKHYVPMMVLKARAGTDNPLTPLLREYGVSFQEFALDAKATPEDGLNGRGHLYGLRYDTIRIDTTYLMLDQDSSLLKYKAAVICRNQPLVPGFVALFDGYSSPKEVDAHLRYFNQRREKGLDLGLHAENTDSAVNISLYPEQPVLGFERFELNKDHFIQLDLIRDEKTDSVKMGLVKADVLLSSLDDSTLVVIGAGPNATMEQMARIAIRNLDLGGLLNLMPYAPKIGGLMNMDVTYDVNEKQFKVLSDVEMKRFVYEGMKVGDLHSKLVYAPEGLDVHTVDASLDYNDIPVMLLKGSYSTETPEGYLNANLDLLDTPLSLLSPFVPDKMMAFSGYMKGDMKVEGPTDKLMFNGKMVTTDVHVLSEPYSLDLRLDNDTAYVENSRIKFDHYKIYGAGDEPLDFDGYFDFADTENMYMSLSLYGYGFKLIEAKRSRAALLFGDIYGDIMFRLHGSMQDLTVRGAVNVLSKTNMTYVMKETPLSQGARLDDIVTFVDFNAPPDTTKIRPQAMGIDMRVVLRVEEGAKFNCEFSADRQSYVVLRTGGQVTLGYTPEGVLNMIGRFTVTEGEMKYTLPIIPLRTFNIASGSYVDFTGDPMNPTMNIRATERMKAMVSSEGASARSVAFDVGVEITNTLSNMGLQFTIDAPNDNTVKDELSAATDEEKNKLAVALMATGMYLSSTNASSTESNSALNSFLQSEINNLTGKALNSVVDVSVGIDNTTYSNGEQGTDYSFKFTKRFFSDRLNVVIGGTVSSNKNVNKQSNAGSFIDDISLEWRLDNSANRYVRLFHGKDYNNVVEGVLNKTGAGLLLKKKVDKVTDLFIFRNKRRNETIQDNEKK